jgi:hypothetical protein
MGAVEPLLLETVPHSSLLSFWALGDDGPPKLGFVGNLSFSCLSLCWGGVVLLQQLLEAE